jgi:3-mercaptopyruvate sulfurtransferase SseA
MRPNARSPFLMLAAVLSVWVLSGCERETRDTDIKLVSVGEVKALWDRKARGSEFAVLFVDPRPAKAFNAGHITGARNLPLPHIDPKGDRDPMIERFDNIVVYGDDPGSATARGMTKRLLAVGYKHIRFFAGGLEQWKARGYPTEDAPASRATPAPTEAPSPPENPGSSK